jgi:hypothetical protein
MLTPEERQRIEAEEQYRAEVRARLERQPVAPIEQPSRLPWILGIGAVLIVAAAIIWSSSSKPKGGDDVAPAAEAPAKSAPAPKTRYMPVNQKIATGQIIVKANGYVQYRLTITPEMVDPTVTGSFNASGGSGNDIQAAIADEPNYMNWINGHPAQVFWGTQDKQTTAKFDVKLAPGMYYLVFSNKFSAFTDKQVFVEVDLNYKRAETYYE